MDNIHPDFNIEVSRQKKELLLNQIGLVFWFTGLSGSGKSTIASEFERTLYNRGYLTQLLDGDNIRSGINANLSFSDEDRLENIRRVAEIAKLSKNSGIITICSFISPLISMRNKAKEIIGEKDFIEVFVDTPLAVCEQRDVKGLYKKARAGEIKNFTGLNAPFEKPISPQIILKTTEFTPNELAIQLYDSYIK